MKSTYWNFLEDGKAAPSPPEAPSSATIATVDLAGMFGPAVCSSLFTIAQLDRVYERVGLIIRDGVALKQCEAIKQHLYRLSDFVNEELETQRKALNDCHQTMIDLAKEIDAEYGLTGKALEREARKVFSK
jgi:hypothetical protein